MSDNCDINYVPATVAFEVECNKCKKIANFIISSNPLKNPRKCYNYTLCVTDNCNCTGYSCIDIKNRDKQIDIDDLHKMIDNININFEFIRIKLRESYYILPCTRVTLCDSYYW